MEQSLFTDLSNAQDLPPESPYPLALQDFTEGELLPPAELDTTSFKSPIYDGSQPVWPSLLTFELALGLNKLDTILEKYGLSAEDYEFLSQLPAFRSEMVAHTARIQKDGLTFKIKTAAQAESYLEELDGIVRNHQNPVSTRLDAIKCAVKWAGLEPKDEKGDGNQTNQQFNISITF